MLNALFRPALLAGVVALATVASAQNAPKLEFPAASPVAKLEQRVGLTDVAVVYARPSIKGRKVFGELVPYGEVWRTGANTATSISFSTAVKFGGADVPAGKYALFTIPDAKEWTIILSKVTDQWGSYQYDAKDDVVRVKAKPAAIAESLETFEIGFTELRDASAAMTLTWEKTRVPVKIEVDLKSILVPQIEAAMAAPGKKDYLGAAMFYYENDLDLKKAAEWIAAGVAENPKAFWMSYRQGLILAKLGDKKGALAAAQASMAAAKEAGGPVKDEYVRLNEALIAKLK